MAEASFEVEASGAADEGAESPMTEVADSDPDVSDEDAKSLKRAMVHFEDCDRVSPGDLRRGRRGSRGSGSPHGERPIRAGHKPHLQQPIPGLHPVIVAVNDSRVVVGPGRYFQ